MLMARLPALLTLLLMLASGTHGRLTMAQLTVRNDIGTLLEGENMTVGVELGVQAGWFSKQTLEHWPSCKRYYLVDVWRPLENYNDLANVPLAEKEAFLEEARRLLKPFNKSTVFMRMFTSEAVKHFKDKSLDFVYVDARHDYCAVKEDILLYWPKVRPGGILAGHDFYYANGPTGGDWSLCGNGERHPEAVKGAVVEFAQRHGLPVCVTKEPFPSWLIRKPRRRGQHEPGCMSADEAAVHGESLPIPPRLRKRRLIQRIVG
eukprot:EG_transcript_24272